MFALGVTRSPGGRPPDAPPTVLKVRHRRADDSSVSDGGVPPAGLGNRLAARWERRRVLDAGAEYAREAAASAKARERTRKLWAKARDRQARLPREDVRHTVLLRLPVPADVVWRALVDPAGPHTSFHAPLLAAGTLPGPPADAPGARTCTLAREPSGDVAVTLDQVVHAEPGRRIARQSLQSPYRTVTGWWVEPDGAHAAVVRGFTELTVPRMCAWQASQVADADLRRRAWELSAALTGPETAGPRPSHAPLTLDGILTRVEATGRLARGPRVAVTASATADLTGVPVHAAWVAVCSATGPSVEHGDPEAHWVPLRGGPAGPASALRCALVRHPLGHVDAFVDEVVESAPGVRLVTRGLSPFDVEAEVELTPRPTGTAVEVTLRQEVLPDVAEQAHRILVARAHMNARRIDRQARGGHPSPLDDVWFP